MAAFAWVLIAVLGGALLAFSAWAAADGFLAAIDALTRPRPRRHRRHVLR